MAYTLLINGRFAAVATGSVDEQIRFDECMVIEDDTIRFIGDAAAQEVADAKDKGATVQDLNGRTVLPGFMDGHIHILLMGQALGKASLEKCKNLSDIRATIKEYAQSHPHVPRILCRAWMHIMTEGRAETSMLDDLDPRPIYIDSKDLHSCWLNRAAVKELGLDPRPDPAGGKIHRDEDGIPTGLVSEAACVFEVWPQLAKMSSLEDRVTSLRLAIRELHKAGYTGFVDMAMDDVTWEALLALKATDELPMRIAAHWFIKPTADEASDLAQVDKAIELNSLFNASKSPDLRIVGIKVMLDGVVDACTAALTEPYASGTSADTHWTLDQLTPVVEKADRAGMQCAIHAIGDAAVQIAIGVLSRCAAGNRHRIEHLELTRPGDAARLSSAGITASIQPVHADPAVLRYWPTLLGEERCKRAFAYREFADAGATLAMGSDAPTSPWSPLWNMYVAATRRSAREPHLTTTVNPGFALSLCQSVAAATAGTAYSCFADGTVGKLAPGLKADFVIADMAWDAEKLLEARVHETWYGGRPVYRSDA